jgi:hypothetical protein
MQPAAGAERGGFDSFLGAMTALLADPMAMIALQEVIIVRNWPLARIVVAGRRALFGYASVRSARAAGFAVHGMRVEVVFPAELLGRLSSSGIGGDPATWLSKKSALPARKPSSSTFGKSECHLMMRSDCCARWKTF